MDNGTAEDSNINYHGLINQGATCYLNSVLQVLFMTKDFREAVTGFPAENPHNEFDHYLKALFDDLQKNTTKPSEITKRLGINNVYEQRDAAEYVERVLRQTSHEASKIFHGLLANRITCHKCHTKTDRDAPFWHLPLSLVDFCKGDYRVVDGIEEFFRPTELNGENQMYCDQCDEKVDATIADVIKHHPDVLILLLKRFEFNYDYMSYVKISCSVEVPYTLHIPETYELYAFVDHFGDLRSGHYTATIKIQKEHDKGKKDTWYEFNDSRITLSINNQPSQNDDTIKSETIYLLFYKKEKKDTQNFRDMSTIEAPPKYDQETEQTRKTEEGEKKAEHLNGKDLNDKRIYIDSKEEENDSFNPANVGKAGYKEKMKINVAENMKGKTGADESATGSKQLLTIYDLYCYSVEELVRKGIISRLKRNKPLLPEQQKHGTKRKKDGETISSNPNKIQKVCDAQGDTAGIEHTLKDLVKQKGMKKGQVQEK